MTMAVPYHHLRHQLPVIASLAGTALAALRPRRGPGPSLPSAGDSVQTIAPRAPALVRDYLRHVGGDPAAYRGVLPPHLFPQWGFPLAARTLAGVPYPLQQVLNGGCRLEINAPLPRRPAAARARAPARHRRRRSPRGAAPAGDRRHRPRARRAGRVPLRDCPAEVGRAAAPARGRPGSGRGSRARALAPRARRRARVRDADRRRQPGALERPLRPGPPASAARSARLRDDGAGDQGVQRGRLAGDVTRLRVLGTASSPARCCCRRRSACTRRATARGSPMRRAARPTSPPRWSSSHERLPPPARTEPAGVARGRSRRSACRCPSRRPSPC